MTAKTQRCKIQRKKATEEAPGVNLLSPQSLQSSAAYRTQRVGRFPEEAAPMRSSGFRQQSSTQAPGLALRRTPDGAPWAWVGAEAAAPPPLWPCACSAPPLCSRTWYGPWLLWRGATPGRWDNHHLWICRCFGGRGRSSRPDRWQAPSHESLSAAAAGAGATVRT